MDKQNKDGNLVWQEKGDRLRLSIQVSRFSPPRLLESPFQANPDDTRKHHLPPSALRNPLAVRLTAVELNQFLSKGSSNPLFLAPIILIILHLLLIYHFLSDREHSLTSTVFFSIPLFKSIHGGWYTLKPVAASHSRFPCRRPASDSHEEVSTPQVYGINYI